MFFLLSYFNLIKMFVNLKKNICMYCMYNHRTRLFYSATLNMAQIIEKITCLNNYFFSSGFLNVSYMASPSRARPNHELLLKFKYQTNNYIIVGTFQHYHRRHVC